MSISTPAITITRRLEFDAGHRIPHHDGQCRHLHGHRYAICLLYTSDAADDVFQV
jgi:6-pyruvoyltetrahydropterin/6-carboxytetrahydropterin synthase